MDPDRLFLEKFNPYFEEIEKELKKTFHSRIAVIEEIGMHSLLGKGKRIRPLLFILSSRLCGYEGEDIYHISTMFEYVHCASLLHDDVIDNADMRRNKPSASRIWGNSAAVLTGDFLSSRAMEIAVDAENMGLFEATTKISRRMIEGQFLELINTNNWNISRDKYTEIITSKTAELMSAACFCGAIISGREKETRESLQQFGLNLGVAFQLVDDLLDYASTEEQFGKPVCKDLKEGKITLPLIYALPLMGKNQAKRLEAVFKASEVDEKDFMQVIEFVRGSGVLEKIRAEAKTYVDKASGFLTAFPDSTYKDDLIFLNEYVAERKF